jgi:uncharacterized protein (TIGR00375 family)
MKIIADLQIHSKYSRAVSQRMNIEEIFTWAVRKGIGLMATGDWTHPLWVREIKEKLVETGRGTLSIKQKHIKEITKEGNIEIENATISQFRNFAISNRAPEFLLATEISSIYSQGDKVRRIHNLVWVSRIKTAEAIIAELVKRGCNLGSDGRPIVGLTSQEIAELVLTIDETALIIPAHAWTPWFSLYGSKSGFDSVEECFGPYAKHIYAIETGLSSDPVMNWQIPDLHNRSIVSFSDAHSGPKIGREATVFDISSLSFTAIREAIINSNAVHLQTENQKSKIKNKISCTFEFYPEEGKYHFNGHRSCNIRYTPEETKKKGFICPVCGRPLTIGVAQRVAELSKQVDPVIPIQKLDANGVRWMYHPKNLRPPYVNLVPLAEILAEVLEVSSTSVKVFEAYERLTAACEGEFNVLLKTSLETIRQLMSQRAADGIKQVRAGTISIDPGYDGVFGVVKVWREEEKKEPETQQESLF